jgi:asparaginyl-tRNA synthetase
MAPIVRIEDIPAHAGQPVTLRGWVTTTRSSGKIAFAVLRDGTGLCQAVFVKNALPPETWEQFKELTLECSVELTGIAKVEPRAPGGRELEVQALTIIGASPITYPIQPKEHGVDFLLDNRHLWLRSQRQAALMRIRHEIEQTIHDFFYGRGFLRMDSPILTAAIGERAGLFETEYFDLGTAYLAQTGQLYGEAGAAAFGRIYTFGPTFRAEKSKTRRHLTEFWMIEPEMAWYDQAMNMQLQEDLIVAIVERVLDRRMEELKQLERDTSKLETVKGPFTRLDYSDAVTLVQSKGSDAKWGDDLGAEDEALIVEGRDRPVFVCNYPKEAKAFYMKENPADPRTVLCADLLAPEGYGEIIGGSQREDDLDKLIARIQHEKLPMDAYEWYLDLRRYGTFTHSGFGLGLERMVAWVSGTHHIRECIPFPRLMSRIYP